MLEFNLNSNTSFILSKLPTSRLESYWKRGASLPCQTTHSIQLSPLPISDFRPPTFRQLALWPPASSCISTGPFSAPIRDALVRSITSLGIHPDGRRP